MNPAALAQSQNFITLLQALAAAGTGDLAQQVEARLIALTGDGTATAEIAGRIVDLRLAGPQAQQAALQPGATLVLKLAPPQPGETASRATLVEIRPPSGPAAVASRPSGSAASPPADPDLSARPHLADMLPAATIAKASPTSTDATLRPQAADSAPAAAMPVPVRHLAGPLLAQALRNQDGLAPLLANLRSLARGEVSLTLPRPLLQLAERVLAHALPGETTIFTAPQLREAVRQSGLFHEATARATPATAAPLPGAAPAKPAATPAPLDLKAQLTALRDVSSALVASLSTKAASVAPEAAASVAVTAAQVDPSRPPPPRRDAPLAAQPIAEPSLSAGDKPLAIAETVLRQSDAALDRLKLAQFASLPPETTRADTQPPQRWLVELPLAFQNGTAMMPLEIEREPPRRETGQPQGPAWQVRFALDVEPLGPLQGTISLRGRAVGVTLWAEREPTTRLLRGAAPGLEAALIGAEFETGEIEIHTGEPAIRQATAGQFFDRVS